MTITAGSSEHEPLGATWDGRGVQFSIWSEAATQVILCLFDRSSAGVEHTRTDLHRSDGGVWHGYVPGAGPGQLYAYRLDGSHDPAQGAWFNPHKLLIDPYARALNGPLRWHETMQDHSLVSNGWTPRDTRDSAAFMPKCVVVDSGFDWGDDRPLRTPWERTVIYECPVKGLTMRHPEVDPPLRGTYAALATQPIIRHLQGLGVTAVELLPVQQFLDEQHVVQRGLRNYWGYSPIAYLAPEARYATAANGEQVLEFKRMVRELHCAGIEVLLDVVYNHTGEGDHRGPTLCFRGIDNAAYYRLDPADPQRYLDTSGCGNSLHTAHPRVLQLVLDSLRYWVQEMHVDGFRFDLAPAMERGLPTDHELWDIIRRDAVLREVKLIAEPWDLGPDGYRLGRFPKGWAEWNDGFRDRARRFWRGDASQAGELAYSLTGSSDSFEPSGRTPSAGINFIAAHDGFTLHDLVSYGHKHNDANAEDNHDGTDRNFSRNWGIEGATDALHILELRESIKRNFLATLAFSRGIPMICAGDEMGRTQRGNNNAYCQDNETSWLDWRLDRRGRELLGFTCRVFELRRENPVFRSDEFYGGSSGERDVRKDLIWLREDGAEMTHADWMDTKRQVLAMLLTGTLNEGDNTERHGGNPVLLLLINGGGSECAFHVPPGPLSEAGVWRQLLDTASRPPVPIAGRPLILAAHSLQLLRFEPQP